jgi:hypothetical protein
MTACCTAQRSSKTALQSCDPEQLPQTTFKVDLANPAMQQAKAHTTCALLCLQVLWGNRNVAFVVVLPLALAAEGTSWQWVAALRPADWGAVVFIGALVAMLYLDQLLL